MKLRLLSLAALILASACSSEPADSKEKTAKDAKDGDDDDTKSKDDEKDEDETKDPPVAKPTVSPFSVATTETTNDAFVRWGSHVGRRSDGSFLVFGGSRASSQKNDVSVVTVSDTALDAAPLTATDAPPGRTRAAFFVDPDADRAYLRGGRLSGAGIADGDLFMFDVASKAWTKVDLATQPEAIVGPSTVWSTAKKAGYFFGGAVIGESAKWLAETWRFDTKPAPKWTKLDATGPSARYDAVLVASEDGKKLVLFGGGKGVPGSGFFENDVWTFDTTTETWTEIPATSAVLPTQRRGAFGALSKSGRELFIACGEASDAPQTDGWSFDLDSGVWTKVFADKELPESTFSARIGSGRPGWLVGGYTNAGVGVNAKLLRFEATETSGSEWK